MILLDYILVGLLLNLLNGYLQANSKLEPALALGEKMDLATDGITIEYFGNYYPTKILNFYSLGFNIGNGSSGGYDSGIVVTTKYTDLNDETKDYTTGIISTIEGADGKTYAFNNDTGKNYSKINEYSHIVVKFYN